MPFDPRQTADPIIRQVQQDVADEFRRLRKGELAGLAAILAGRFGSLAIQKFESAGAAVYRPTAGMKACLVICTGGGGGGAGADTDGNTATVGVGGGGGAGATAIRVFSADEIGNKQDLAVGAGGGGGANTGGNGSSGGSSTFGTFLTAPGGGGSIGAGTSTNASCASAGGSGGAVATGGHLNLRGGAGNDGVGGSSDGTTDITFAISGAGGGSLWSTGAGSVARAQNSLTADADVAGNPAGNRPGVGGSGAVSLNSTTGAAGGAGTAGVVFILEFLADG